MNGPVNKAIEIVADVQELKELASVSPLIFPDGIGVGVFTCGACGRPRAAMILRLNHKGPGPQAVTISLGAHAAAMEFFATMRLFEREYLDEVRKSEAGKGCGEE